MNHTLFALLIVALIIGVLFYLNLERCPSCKGVLKGRTVLPQEIIELNDGPVAQMVERAQCRRCGNVYCRPIQIDFRPVPYFNSASEPIHSFGPWVKQDCT